MKPALVIIALLLSSCAIKGLPGHDFSELGEPVVTSHPGPAPDYDGRVQIIAFNIERGRHWEDIVAYVKARQAVIPATILLLSECDRYHSRSGDVFVADEMAKTLGMDMVFATEYVEYNDKTPDTQGDHGNAILSPYPMSAISVIRHSTAFSWTWFGWIDNQPRFGERVSIGATITLPGGTRIRVNTVHFESVTDETGKWVQMKEVIDDSAERGLPTVIGGDFNELPGFLLFRKMKNYGFVNAFEGDNSPTGSCKPAGDRAKCKRKIDWIVHKGLELESRSVDYPLNSEGGVISDHAPVRAVFRVE